MNEVPERTTLAKMEWERETVPHIITRRRRNRFVREHFRMLGGAIAWVEWPSRCELLKIEALAPRTGAASRLLARLQSVCDRFNVPIFGNATAYEPSTEQAASWLNQEELEEWYRRRGFALRRGSTCGVVEIWYPDALC